MQAVGDDTRGMCRNAMMMKGHLVALQNEAVNCAEDDDVQNLLSVGCVEEGGKE